MIELWRLSWLCLSFVGIHETDDGCGFCFNTTRTTLAGKNVDGIRVFTCYQSGHENMLRIVSLSLSR